MKRRMTKDGGVEYSILFPLNEKEILKEAYSSKI